MELIDPRANIKESCQIGAHSRIIGAVTLGENVIIGEYATIYGPAKIGDEGYIGDYTIIGYPKRDELRDMIKKGLNHFGRATNEESIIGKNVIIRLRCTLYRGVKVGLNVEFGHDALVRENTIIGDDTIIGSKVVIDGNCQIGCKVLLHTAAYICPFSKIEDSVFIGPQVTFTNDKYANQIPVKLVGPTIKEKASIGAGAIVLPRVSVGESSLIGAGSVVTKDTEPDTIYVGNPAQKLRRVREIMKRE